MKNNKNTTNPQTLTALQYQTLLDDIKEIFSSSNKTKNYSLINSYHQIGSRISQELITKKAGYFPSIIKDLAKDLEIKASLLSRIINFYQAYSNQEQINKNISWSHYRELITIKDIKLRKELEKEIVKNQLTKNELILKIRNIKSNNQNNIQSNQNNLLSRPTKPSYLYKAKIEEVIDGDTILVNIDLGFQCHKKQRIRLSNINAKEISSKEGRKSFEFLRKKATEAENIVIKTNKIDIYGRYVADVFYDPFPHQNNYDFDEIFAQGNYLNQELINKGYAEEI